MPITTAGKPPDADEAALQRSLDNIQFAINKTLKALDWVEDNHVADRGPLATTFVGSGDATFPQLLFTQHNETSNPSPVSLRGTLADHLSMLLRMQAQQAELLRRRHAWLVVQALDQEAARAHTRFRTDTRRQLLDNAKKYGEVPADTLRELGKHADVVLTQCVTALDADPSQRNFKLTLESFEDSMLLGTSVDAGAQANALAGLRRAAAKRLLWATNAYRANNTGVNLKSLGDWVYRASWLGCDDAVVQPAIQLLQSAGGAAKK
jgi:hypothetical protein